MIDHFKIINDGSIVLFEPLTPAAQDWWDQNIDPECVKLGRTYAVEHRYAGDIMEGIKTA